MKQNCLMLGAGHAEPKRRLASPDSASEEDTRWTTLDNNKECKPNKLFDLELLETGEQLPFPMCTFDEVHAYEILEHLGRQGNAKGLFSTFRALWIVLKPQGLLMATCPSMTSQWLWAEPGHTRVITHGTLAFLTKNHYDQLGKTSCSDYRSMVHPCWWEIADAKEEGETFAFALRKVA